MYLIIDIILYSIVLSFFTKRKWQLLDITWIVLALAAFYFVTIIDITSIFLVLHFVLVFSISWYTVDSMKIGMNTTFIFNFIGLLAMLIYTKHEFDPVHFFEYMVLKDFLWFLLIKYSIVIPLIYFLKKTIYLEQQLIKYINQVAISIMIVLELIYISMDFGIFNHLGIMDSDYYDYTIVIISFVWFASIVLTYVFYVEFRKRKQLQSTISVLTDEIETVSSSSRNAIIEYALDLAMKDEQTELIEFSNQFLLKSANNELLQKFKDIDDDTIALLIHTRIHEQPDIVFDVVVHNFELSQVSSSEKYVLEIFGILLDNAIEAALKTEEKIVRLEFKESSILISNTFIQEDLEFFNAKSSSKDSTNRINGLKILEFLVQKSNVMIINRIEDMIICEMVVIV